MKHDPMCVAMELLPDDLTKFCDCERVAAIRADERGRSVKSEALCRLNKLGGGHPVYADRVCWECELIAQARAYERTAASAAMRQELEERRRVAQEWRDNAAPGTEAWMMRVGQISAYTEALDLLLLGSGKRGAEQ